MKTFIQRAEGSAKLEVVPGSAHCAISEPFITITYKLAAQFDCAALDEQNFLFDALTFKTYFATLESKPIHYSCEILAAKIADDFLTLLGARKQFCLKITVIVEPFPGVGVEYCAEGNDVQTHKMPAAVYDTLAPVKIPSAPPSPVPARPVYTVEPATEKQVKYMRNLGIKFVPNVSKMQAIKLIAARVG